MFTRLAFGAAVLALAGLALWHPAPRPPLQVPTSTEPRRYRAPVAPLDLVVYVAGAVRRPGLYHLAAGARAAQAVELAGGPTAPAEPGGVNLAARVADGDEIYVPSEGETVRPAASARRARRHRRASPPPATPSTDVNTSDAAQLAAVPGIGRTIAQRIVEMRERDGAFSSLDELLDVAGMTQTRLERARPFLQPP